MATVITSACINCGACEPECPNTAIYQGGVEWELGGRTHPAIATDIFYIVPEKCTECVGFFEQEACAAVCPVDCCVPDPERPESEEVLIERSRTLHPEALFAPGFPSRFRKSGAQPSVRVSVEDRQPSSAGSSLAPATPVEPELQESTRRAASAASAPPAGQTGVGGTPAPSASRTAMAAGAAQAGATTALPEGAPATASPGGARESAAPRPAEPPAELVTAASEPAASRKPTLRPASVAAVAVADAPAAGTASQASAAQRSAEQASGEQRSAEQAKGGQSSLGKATSAPEPAAAVTASAGSSEAPAAAERGLGLELPVLDDWQIPVVCRSCASDYGVALRHVRPGVVSYCPACGASFVPNRTSYLEITAALGRFAARWEQELSGLRERQRQEREAFEERQRSARAELEARLRDFARQGQTATGRARRRWFLR